MDNLTRALTNHLPKDTLQKVWEQNQEKLQLVVTLVSNQQVLTGGTNGVLQRTFIPKEHTYSSKELEKKS